VDELGRAYNTKGKKRNARRKLVGKPEIKEAYRKKKT
jgi:hypothetical protein